jgi:hypothetical protein
MSSLAPIVAETEHEPEPAPVGKQESEPESAPADKPESEPESEPPARRRRCRPPLMALASRASERRWQEEMEAALHEPPPVLEQVLRHSKRVLGHSLPGHAL